MFVFYKEKKKLTNFCFKYSKTKSNKGDVDDDYKGMYIHGYYCCHYCFPKMVNWRRLKTKPERETDIFCFLIISFLHMREVSPFLQRAARDHK